MTEFQRRLAEVNKAIAKCEQAQAACDEAIEQLRQAPAGEPFAAAWSEYERRRAACHFAQAEAEVALEDCYAVQP